MISRRSLLVAAPAIVAARSSVAHILRSPQSIGLSYPAGLSPGFDQTHIAVSGGIKNLISVVCLGSGNLVSLTSGARLTANNSPGVTIVGGIGSALTVLSGTANCTMAVSTATPAGETMACIFQMQTVNTAVTQAFISGSTAIGVSLGTSNPTGFLNFYFNGNNLSNFGFTAGVPYFIVASLFAGSTVNFVKVNLVTGQITTSVKSSSVTTGATRDNPVSFANNVGGTQPLLGYLAAAMYSPTFLQMEELLYWAQRPWDFWYPLGNQLASP